MPDGSPTIDYDRLDFPSDRLTLKQLDALARADDPPLGDLVSYLTAAAEDLWTMRFMETEFADIGFARGTGDPQRLRKSLQRIADVGDELPADAPYDANVAYRRAAAELGGYYEQFGIADGPETARQLIRRLEDQAAAQVRELFGPAGGRGG